MNTSPDSPGIHGKLPSHGDFITRRLPREFVDGWDNWLQHAIATSKADLGDVWLDTYLTSPIWSFVVGAGICGARSWAGVLMPSVDRVGRYFPLTLAVAVPDAQSRCEIIVHGHDWFERARSLALSSLEEEDFSLDTFDASVADLGTATSSDAPATAGIPLGEASMRGLFLPTSAGAEPALLRLAHLLLEQRVGRYSVWWSDGSELVPACVLVSPSLPVPEAYAAFLNGRFRPEHWLGTPLGGSGTAGSGVAV